MGVYFFYVALPLFSFCLSAAKRYIRFYGGGGSKKNIEYLQMSVTLFYFFII